MSVFQERRQCELLIWIGYQEATFFQMCVFSLDWDLHVNNNLKIHNDIPPFSWVAIANDRQFQV